MNIESMRKQLAELTAIVEGWSELNEIATIERDLALDRVKSLYEELKFSTPTVTAPQPEEQVQSEEEELPEIEVELTYYEGDDEQEEEIEESGQEEQTEEEQTEEEQQQTEEEQPFVSINLEDLIIIDEIGDPKQEEQEEQEVQPEELPEEQPAPTPEPQSPSKCAQESSLFDLESIPIRPKSRRSAILSLYSDGVLPTPKKEEQPQPQPQEPEQPQSQEPEPQPQEPQPQEPQPEPIKIDPLTIAPPAPTTIEIVDELIIDDDDEEEQPQEPQQEEQQPQPQEPTQILGDIISSEVETIAQRYASEQSQAENPSWQSAPQSSINDRYIIARDLFGGDMEACDEMLSRLSAIENFDDCMIYIVENYDWNPDDEATRLVLKMLECKFPLN